MTAVERMAGPVRMRDWGGAGAPLLLTHGMAAHSHWWDRVVPHWRDIFHAVAIDFRGHGESLWTPDGVYESRTWVEDVETARKALGWERFLLCGHSMGARIALDYAEAHGDRLRGLVVIDFLPEVRADAASSRFARARGRPQPVYESEEVIVGKFRLEPDGTLLGPDEVRNLGRRSVRPERGGYTWKFDWRSLHFRLTPVWPQLEKVRVPTLIVRGELSTIMSRYDLERTVLGMPRARGIEIPRAHHHVPLDAPRQVADAVAGFASGLSELL